jgi:hypothetical protein
MDKEDAFWAAKQVAAFSDAEIRAIVETAEYSDPRAADWMTRCLVERGRQITKTWLATVVALDKCGVVDGRLTFEELNHGGGADSSHRYNVRWATWDGFGQANEIPGANGLEIPGASESDAKYLIAILACKGSTSCERPVTVYLRRCDRGLAVAGIDR